MPLLNFNIETHNDFEFNSNSQRRVDYSIDIPDGKIKGLVLYIAGFGEDAGHYRKNFQKHISNDYSMACLVVDYHCFFSRPSNGASLSIEPNVMKLLRSITGCINNESVDTVLLELGKMKANPNLPLKIPGTIYPDKKEYQNFGILPALDNIYAINDVFKKFPHIPKKNYAIGSSYGGYVANIVSKFAPCTLNAVFDNSSWATPNFNYIIGHELGFTEFSMVHSPNIILELNVLSPWSHLPFMPNAFNNDRILIRSFPENHINIMSKAGKQKTIYRFVHAENDFIANTKQKFALAENMKNAGFNVQIKIYSQADVDGEYIKNTDHGMGLSMRKFFSEYYNKTRDDIKIDQCIDFDFEHTLQFACETQNYTIAYSGNSQPICSLSDQN